MSRFTSRLLASLVIALLSFAAAGCETTPGEPPPPGVGDGVDPGAVEDDPESTGGAGTGTQLDVDGGPAADADDEDGADG